MKSGGWKTPGVMTVGTKVRLKSPLFLIFIYFDLIVVESQRSSCLKKNLKQLLSPGSGPEIIIQYMLSKRPPASPSLSHLSHTTVSHDKPSSSCLCLLD